MNENLHAIEALKNNYKSIPIEPSSNTILNEILYVTFYGTMRYFMLLTGYRLQNSIYRILVTGYWIRVFLVMLF